MSAPSSDSSTPPTTTAVHRSMITSKMKTTIPVTSMASRPSAMETKVCADLTTRSFTRRPDSCRWVATGLSTTAVTSAASTTRTR